MNLPPSNRPSTRPAARPNAPNRPSTRPAIDRDKIQQGIGNRPGGRPDMPEWFKPGAERPRPDGPIANRPDAERPRPDRPVTRPGEVRPPNSRPPGTRPPIARPGRPNRPWHPNHPNHGRYTYGYWWRGATVVGLTGWLTPVWTTPVYYSYGDGGSVYYENNNVYVDGAQYATASEYYTQATEIASSTPETPAPSADDENEWMPLGVFALTSEGVSASTMYLQLAISKDGVIAGTFYNETTDVRHDVEGMVDEESQRAAWQAADGSNPDVVMETGVYNLTKDETEALVHFGPDETQVWKLVRLDESDAPDESKAAG